MNDVTESIDKPSLRGVSHVWAFFVSLFSGAALVMLARDEDAALVALATTSLTVSLLIARVSSLVLSFCTLPLVVIPCCCC